MKRLLVLSVVGGFLLVLPPPNLVWGKAHVPLKKIQVCHKGATITLGAPARAGHLRHGDCQLPACDFTKDNIFFTGQDCPSEPGPDGFCLLEEPRDSAEGFTDACPEGTF